MEDYKATSRNGHQLTDNYDPETNTLDIRSNGKYPSNVLSNLCSNEFRYDGVVCGSTKTAICLKRFKSWKQKLLKNSKWFGCFWDKLYF